MKVGAWELDWGHPQSTGQKVMARNRTSHVPSARGWHRVSTYYLRDYCGVNTPVYRKDSWEVDWSKRDIARKLVWARNPHSKMPQTREWHWVSQRTINVVGIKWRPAAPMTGRWINKAGYVLLTRRGMTADDAIFAEQVGLFRGTSTPYVQEHRLVIAKKLGGPIPMGMVVRHMNGIKTDNRPENLMIGTLQENAMDHNTARLAAIYWRSKYESLLATVTK